MKINKKNKNFRGSLLFDFTVQRLKPRPLGVFQPMRDSLLILPRNFIGFENHKVKFFVNVTVSDFTVAHRGKTQLNFCSETPQSFEEHNNLLGNATIFFRTQQSFREHNNLVQNTTISSRTQQSIREHNNLFQNTRKFPDAQQYFPKHNKIF